MWKLLWISWQWYTPNSGQWLSLEGREGGEIWIGHTESINWVCQVLFLKLGDDWGVSLLLFTSSGFLKHFMIFKIFPEINMAPPSEQSKGVLIIGMHCLLLTWELISQMRQWRQLTGFHSGRMWICPKSETSSATLRNSPVWIPCLCPQSWELVEKGHWYSKREIDLDFNSSLATF